MIDILAKHGKELSLSKGQYLYQQGDSDGNLYIVVNGLLKVFYITASGKEFVKTFIYEDRYIACISAMLDRGNCTFSVIALEDTKLLVVPNEIMLSLYENEIEGLVSVNRALLDLVRKKEKREYEFLCLSANERYMEFKKEYAQLEHRVSQYDIARYLGITPVALSRIKNSP